MATATPVPLNTLHHTSPAPPLSSSSSSSSLITFRVPKFTVSCSVQTIENSPVPANKKRKPRPSFLEQVQDKWSRKPNILLDKLPWEEQVEASAAAEEKDDEPEEVSVPHSNLNREKPKVISPIFPGNVALPPWVQGNKNRKQPHLDIEDGDDDDDDDDEDDESEEVSLPHLNSIGEKHQESIPNTPKNISLPPWIQGSKLRKESQLGDEDKIPIRTGTGFSEDSVVRDVEDLEESFNLDEEAGDEKGVKNDDAPVGLPEEDDSLLVDESVVENFRSLLHGEEGGSKDVSSNARVQLPWESEDEPSDEGRKLKRNNTEVAEKSVPEPELKRLRNVSLRMVERIKVGAGGVTQELVDSIHEKWKVDEVVKLKFEGPPAKNMRRTHEVLEGRTGGLVIWRSGSSIVLYRGMAYKLDCVQSYSKQAQENAKEFDSSLSLSKHATQNFQANSSPSFAETYGSQSSKYLNKLSPKELEDLSELSELLDELGPRFRDWSGPEPLPVNADLLPSFVRGYRPPFRVLPYGIKPVLSDQEMTFLRRTARGLPPHFALGRSRELQGLAAAMVKLWEKSSIAKIAIKRGVLNTRNDLMAHELKVLTGGTLVSRNKEYIVFYRGNDFLPSAVTQTLVETEKRSVSLHDEEEKARERALAIFHSNVKIPKGPLVAGTLSETKAATSHWAQKLSDEDVEKMMREAAVARHASLVKLLEKKLAIAKGKITKAEKALWKVQETLQPNELPNDLETITDEERFLYRKIGLSMKPFLVLGRRGVFDGTIENVHLHWRYRELVKIFVERKSFTLVKHIAISLEAESGGVLVSVDKTNKGYAIILYRGKNYDRPSACRPKNLLTRRQALARAIELQRREALKRHVSELQGKIMELKSELEHMKTIEEIDEETLSSRVNSVSDDDNEWQEDEGEEQYLETYHSDEED